MKYALALLALSLGLAAPARAAINIYVQDSSSPNCGTTSASGLKGYFQVASFSIGGTQPVSTATGSGSGAGKVSLSNLVITKAVDNCSASLITEFLTGLTIPTLKLVEYDTTASGTSEPLVIMLTNVLISSYNLSDSSGNGGEGVESISFAYQKASITATPASATGTSGTPVTVTYDLTTNVAK